MTDSPRPPAPVGIERQRAGLQLGPNAARSSRFGMPCPHCGRFARVRKSVALTPTYRELRFECMNDACGHVWVAGLEALRTLCPSATPNSDIRIPLAAAIRASINESPAPLAAAG